MTGCRHAPRASGGRPRGSTLNIVIMVVRLRQRLLSPDAPARTLIAVEKKYRLGEIYRRAGRPSPAREHSTVARRMGIEMELRDLGA